MEISLYNGPINKNDICPISRETLVRPVKTSCCSNLFSKEHLKEWVVTNKQETCPLCSTKLDPEGLKNIIDRLGDLCNRNDLKNKDFKKRIRIHYIKQKKFFKYHPYFSISTKALEHLVIWGATNYVYKNSFLLNGVQL